MAQGDWQTSTAVAGPVAAADITDASAVGQAVITATDAAAARTAIGAVIGTDVQAQNAKLAALAGVGSTTGLVRNTGAGTADLVPLGATNATDVPTRADGDARWPRYITALPATDAAWADHRAILIADGYPGVMAEASALGAWSITDASKTFAELMAIASPVAGMSHFVTEINYGGGITFAMNHPWRYTGTQWEPIGDCTLYAMDDEPTITNSVATFQAWKTLVPPVGLFPNKHYVDCVLRTRVTLDGAATYRPIIRINSSTFCDSFASPSNSYHGRPSFKCSAANTLQTGGGADSMDTTTAGNDRVTGTAFNGTVNMEIGASFSGTGSDTTAACWMFVMTIKRG